MPFSTATSKWGCQKSNSLVVTPNSEAPYEVKTTILLITNYSLQIELNGSIGFSYNTRL